MIAPVTSTAPTAAKAVPPSHRERGKRNLVVLPAPSLVALATRRNFMAGISPNKPSAGAIYAPLHGHNRV
jgi:hypothetical protein